MALPEKGQYDNTVSSSKEESLAKAMQIMMEDLDRKKEERVLYRPQVSVAKGVVPIVLFICSFLTLFIFAADIVVDRPVWITRLVIAAIYLVVMLIYLKKLILWLILIYQRFAPDKVRRMCYFEPSCSEYMKLAIEKYGLYRGLYRGCKRLLRCHWPGGVDYP